MNGLIKFTVAITVLGSTAYGAVKLFNFCKGEFDSQVRSLKLEINTCISNIQVLASKDNLLHNTARDSLIEMAKAEVDQKEPDIKRLESVLGMLRDELTAMIQSK